MILPFSTKINDKPTYFVEKILIGIDKHLGTYHTEQFLKDYKKKFESKTPVNFNSKIHTIREDKTDRWKPGRMIDYYINCRQKNMFRFAPRVPVVSVQEVFMTKRGNELEITISKVGSYIGGDDFYLYHDAKTQLALNDGFDNLQDFNFYFLQRIDENYKQTGNSWLKGKIIHWTDKIY